MKILLLPENNSLSHIAKCLAIREALESRGHEASIAVSGRHAEFIKNYLKNFFLLPDIQEADFASYPTINWFKRPGRITECIRAEADLIMKEKPDRILGVFRFTGKASAAIAGVPYDTLICGCMIPDSDEVLGYFKHEPGYQKQKEYLETFYRYAAEKINKAFRELGIPAIGEMRELFKGEQTFLWDFPEFMPIKMSDDIIHAGPITWNRWNANGTDNKKINNDIKGNGRFAVVSFGTTAMPVEVAVRIIKILLKMKFNVVFAAGGRKEVLDKIPDDPGLIKYLFAPINEILPLASIIITHGGQMTIFESLNHKVPVLAMPFQPEQLHNGLCLERIGCGARLVIPEPFRGSTDVYIDAFNKLSDNKICDMINRLLDNPLNMAKLEDISNAIGRYNGTQKIVELIEAR